MYFAIDSHTEGTWSVTRVVGDLDLATIAKFRTESHHELANSTNYAVDLSECALIDSVGMGVVVGLARRARDAKKSFAVVTGERSRRCFERARLDEILNLVERSGLDELVGAE